MKMGAFVLGYHGCDREVAEGLLSGEEKFKASKNDHDWLGHGVYFWENNPKRALEWARFMASHPKFKKRVKEPYAVGAVIDVGNCLDLTEAVSLEIVGGGYQALKETFELVGTPLPENKAVSSHDEDLLQRYLDCAVINHVHGLREMENREAFASVRGAFHEGEALYPGASIKKKTHIQLCVCDLQNIRGIFRIQEIDKL